MSDAFRSDGGLEGDSQGGMIEAISFDFANTLVPVRRATFRALVNLMVTSPGSPVPVRERPVFLAAWEEERDRQFREVVPAGREVDLEERIARVLARLRGLPAPPPGQRWDDAAARGRSGADERAQLIEGYVRSFVTAAPPPPTVGPMLRRLRDRGLRLGILSNWPLAVAVERYAEAAGWRPMLSVIVVSQRVGAIKPSPRIFAVAATELDLAGDRILHLGDDWTADVVGARCAGWRAGFLRGQETDWPRQPIDPAVQVTADLVIDRLDLLEGELDRWRASAKDAGAR